MTLWNINAVLQTAIVLWHLYIRWQPQDIISELMNAIVFDDGHVAEIMLIIAQQG